MKKVYEQLEENLTKEDDIFNTLSYMGDKTNDKFEKIIKKAIAETRKQTLKDVLELIDRKAEKYYGSRADKIVTNHRNKCKGWKSGKPCIKCWGGGTKKVVEEYSKDLKKEIKKLGE